MEKVIKVNNFEETIALGNRLGLNYYNQICY